MPGTAVVVLPASFTFWDVRFVKAALEVAAA
jgi:hypothetical protein